MTTIEPIEGQALGPAPRTLDDVPGWLKFTDQMLFEWFLTRPGAPPGDLLELGVFQGKTSIHMGRFRRAGEIFTVCDLFDLARADDSIRPGARKAYADLTQATFERNFLAFHDELPTIVRGRTDTIVSRVAPATCRFVHIDASHMYEHVRGDLLSARKLACMDGIVVFDDYRTEHTPGTAAAVWEAVAVEGLRIICVTANKFYGTWGDATAIQEQLIEMIAGRSDHRCDLQSVMGQRLIRVVRLPKPAPPAQRRVGLDDATRQVIAEAQQVLGTAQSILTQARRHGHGGGWRTARTGWRRAALALMPPVAADAIRQLRHPRPRSGSR
jgi:hypothetical protein